MPRLRDLEAEFTKSGERPPNEEELRLNPWMADGHTIKFFRRVETLAEADGIWFLCPLCFAKNGGAVGTHSVAVPFPNAPNGAYIQGPNGTWPKWQVVGGTTLDDLQLSPSILLLSGCGWHGFVGSSGVPSGEAR